MPYLVYYYHKIMREVRMNDKTQIDIDFEKIISFWIKSSDNDFKTMKNLHKSKDYHWSLFIGHLVIEKLLKALCEK